MRLKSAIDQVVLNQVVTTRWVEFEWATREEMTFKAPSARWDERQRKVSF